ncbi:hypothetical protein LSH36_184g09008 [Paralvinella palmiformis]|uniref:Uncharacterized protein n=1 Tax=Paralvinella palmiformis TaxID=53620 RepID=A0AAD9JR02_9ANNE|nr:hypothetical protein LSH36_184g09008 [Paralvinella palmiformis]
MSESRKKSPPTNAKGSAAFNQYGVASYTLDHRTYLAENGELFILHWLPFGDDQSIADRLARTTFSHSLKAYPRRAPSKPKYRVCFVDQKAPFRAMTKREVDQITRRLSRTTTEASRRMHNADRQDLDKSGESKSERFKKE